MYGTVCPTHDVGWASVLAMWEMKWAVGTGAVCLGGRDWRKEGRLPYGHSAQGMDEVQKDFYMYFLGRQKMRRRAYIPCGCEAR